MKQDVVLVADLAHALEVALGRREAAAGVLHRLEDHAATVSGPSNSIRSRDRLGQVLGAVARAAGRGSCSATWQPPGVSGSNGARSAVMPVALSAPSVVPW